MRTAITVLAAMTLVCSAAAQQNLLPNPSFEAGEDAPGGWIAASDDCTWSRDARTGDRALAVTGDGTDSTFWRTDTMQFEPGGLYEFSTWMRRAEGLGGSAITGPHFANRDVRPADNWSQSAHIFRVPDADPEGYVRVGHWRAQGTLLFDDARIVPVTAVPVRDVDLALGEGEMIADGRYVHRAPAGGYAGNYSRCLHSHSAHFNTHRWVFFPGAEVIYRHDLGGVAMAAAEVAVTVGWYSAGVCIVEAGVNGENWTELGEIGAQGTERFDLPAALLLAAEALFIRLRSPGAGERGEDSAPGSFQVHSYSFEAELADDVEQLHGATTFLIEETRSDRIVVVPETVGGPPPQGRGHVELTLRNPGAEEMTVTAALALDGPGQQTRTESTVTLAAGADQRVTLINTPVAVGEYAATLSVTDADGEDLYRAGFSLVVPELERADFGYPVGADDAAELWWCEGTYRVNRTRGAPQGEPRPVTLAASRGEYEPAQVVVRPRHELANFTATLSDFTGPDGATISAAGTSILRVAYVFVHTPTDEQGSVGWWPDPLPPLDAPIDLQADQNQPLWLRVQVPRDARPGDYRATLSLEADGWSAEVPIELRVYNFEMPEERSMVATMGFNASLMRRYHHLQTDEQVEEVFERYMRSFREHRIDPYRPWLQGPRTELVGIAWSGGEIVQLPDAPAGEHVLMVVDDDPEGSPSAATVALIEIEREQEYTLSFIARAEEGHEFQTTIGCHDADGRWMSGRNIDERWIGTGDWERYTAEVPAGRIAEGCVAVRVTLRPTRWVEEGTPTGTVWFDDVSLRSGEDGENLIADGDFEGGPEGARIEVDFSDWDPWVERYVDGLGFQSFRLPISYMPRKDAPGRVGPYLQGTEAYDRIMGEYLHTLQEHLREKGWLDVGYAYWIDEPTPEHYENVRYGMRLLGEYAPDIQRMLTEQPEEELFGYVDIWCPVLHNYVEEHCRARQAAGEQIWWYVCTGPKAPWAGLFIDHNAIDLRIWQWMTWKYDVEGCLIWQTNYWNSPGRQRETGLWQNPWEDPMAWRSDGGGWWGNGDGKFFYPPQVDPNEEHEPIVADPITSLRWEMLREGLEDWELFNALRQGLEGRDEPELRALLEIPQQIIANPREFTRDPRLLYAHRRALLEALELLGE